MSNPQRPGVGGPPSGTLPTQSYLPTFADLYPNLASQGYRGMQLMNVLDALAGRLAVLEDALEAPMGYLQTLKDAQQEIKQILDLGEEEAPGDETC